MPQVGKWTDEGDKAKPVLTPEQLEEQKSIRTPGCGTGILLIAGNVAIWWWAIAQVCTLLRG